MKKKLLHKNQAPCHNVSKCPPSAKTPWTLTLEFPLISVN
jgi:hypothetical protein